MLWDIYVLAKAREKKYIQAFLDTWAKGFEEVADEYLLPQYSKEPEKTFTDAYTLIELLIQEPQQSYSIYWRNPEKKAVLAFAMVFFTLDRGMIVGVSIRQNNIENSEDILFQLANTVDGEFGSVFFETPPPDLIEEFKQAVLLSPTPKIAKS